MTQVFALPKLRTLDAWSPWDAGNDAPPGGYQGGGVQWWIDNQSNPFIGSGGGYNPFTGNQSTTVGPIPGYPSSGGFDLGDIVNIVGGVFSGNPGAGAVAAGGSTAKVGSSVASALNPFSYIDWGRIAAILLGLLLIAGGLYLIKPVQKATNVTVKAASKGLAESAA